MIEQSAYLIVLLGALFCLGLIDHRAKLAFFYDQMRTVKTLALGLFIFFIWDLAGVQLGIFFIGETQYLTGLTILPNIPIEELFFLLLLNYNALLLWRGGGKLWSRT